MDIERALRLEVQFSASRSGGAGGQNVNKVSTKILLRWSIPDSECCSPEEKQRLLTSEVLQPYLTGAQDLLLTEQAQRTQDRNRQRACERFEALLRRALLRPKQRRATKIPRGVIRKRREDKRKRGVVKQLRRVGRGEE
jgi:ribosome-associated protein